MNGGVPVELVFNPNWWYQNYSISFDESFYLCRKARIENDCAMRRALCDRFDLGQGEPAAPRPVIGSPFVAGGFVIPALLGVKIQFDQAAAPTPVCSGLSPVEIQKLTVPDIRQTWPMNLIMADVDTMTRDYGYVVGDLNTDGILNTALHLRGNDLFTDFYDQPGLVSHLFQVIAETIVIVAEYLKRVSGSCSIAVNRSVLNFDCQTFLHANCSLQMISPEIYRQYLLPWDLYLAKRLQPYGIHHCGSNFHAFCDLYSQIPASFFDVGWGSDVALSRQRLPDAFLNLRLSPVRMLQQSREQIVADAIGLLTQAKSGERVGLCCINMDCGTPDENVRALLNISQAPNIDETERR